MSKAILFFADGLEECEGLLVVDLLRRAGITVQTVSVSGRAEVTSAHNVTLRCDAVAETADLTDADAVVLPGGMPGTTHLAESALVARTVRSYAAQGKLVAAICAAPTVLQEAGVLDAQHHVTCYPSCQMEIECNWVDEPVVEHAGVITGQAPGSAMMFAVVVLSALAGESTAKKVSRGLVFHS